jgi:prenyltransferase beta subunit
MSVNAFKKILVIAPILSAMIAPTADAQSRRTRPARGDSDIALQPNQVRGDEITPAQKASVEKGLAWLAQNQAKDGSFGGQGSGAQSGITALAGLAFMSNGNMPGRGKYGDNVQRCVDYILASSQESGLLSSDAAHGVMYSHGFATLFLGEVYGMTGDEQVKEKLQRAVRLIQKCQNTEGGWRYMPVPMDADISVTICQIMGLRSARDAGIKVEKEVIDKAIVYVRGCQNADGGFNYMRSGGGSEFPRSAAGVASLYYAGVFEGNDLKRGLDYLRQYVPGKGGASSHYYYGHYYAAQAMFLAGGEYWAEWYPAIRDELISKQAPNGQFPGEIAPAYGTACALIILQMPNRYLPVFNGKGPGS